MRELEITLAIALSFLLFSTFASMFLELFYRLLNTRFKGLKTMLSEFCAKEMSSFAKSGNDNTSVPDMVTQFVDEAKRKHTITTVQFIERLAATDAGKEIAKYGQQELTVLVSHIGRRYDTFCEAATQSFKKKSEMYTMIISVIMALVFNINVVTLGNTFIENRSLTNELVAQTNVIVERAELQQKNLQKLLDTDIQPDEMSTGALQESLNRLRESYQGMERMQLPIGWSRRSLHFFELEAAKLGCGYKSSESDFPIDKCKDSQQLNFWAIAGISWIITTLITGLLIGLGGPFWFDIVKQISVFRTALSSATTDKNQTQEQSTGNDKDPQKDLVKIFEETVKAGELIANTQQPYLPPAPSSVRLG